MAKIDLDLFEKVLFKRCLDKNPEFLGYTIEYLDGDLFNNKNFSKIIDIIKDFYLENSKPPTLTELKIRISTNELKEQLKDAVNDVKNIDLTGLDDSELIKNTEYFIKQRKYYNIIRTAAEHHSSDKEMDIDFINREVDKIHSISLIDNLGLDFFNEIDRMVEYFSKEDTFISSGYKSLDEAFGGGFFKEGRSFYVIGGETNVGKSIVLANIVANVLMQKQNAIIYTLEMSEMRYAKRISSILTGIAISQLKDHTQDFIDYITTFKEDYMSRLIIKEFPTKSINAKQLTAFTRTLERKKNFVPNLLAFDYHALMLPSIKQTAKHSELQYITQECRGMTYFFNAPGLSVTQLNRTSHKASNPGLDTTSGSWDMISDVDGQVNIWQTDEDREANLLRFAGKKARDGSKGHEGALEIDYNTLRLTETEIEDKSAELEDNIGDIIDVNNF